MKYLLFFFNFIFWISGIVLIVVGGVAMYNYGNFTLVSEKELATGPVFLIVIGVIVSFIGFLGCCGAYKENYCMVTTFAILLGIIFVLEIAAGAYAYSRRDKLDEYATKALKKAVDNYSNDKETIDKVQREFKCCGAESYKDYFGGDNNATFPTSCCKNETDCPATVGAAKEAKASLFREGCVKAVESFLKKHLIVVGGVGVGIAFIQVIGIVFACCLMRSIKKEYEVM